MFAAQSVYVPVGPAANQWQDGISVNFVDALVSIQMKPKLKAIKSQHADLSSRESVCPAQNSAQAQASSNKQCTRKSASKAYRGVLLT